MSFYPAENEHERILPKTEIDTLRNRIKSLGGLNKSYSWPLSEPRPPHAEAFQDYYFEQELGYPALRQIFAEHDIKSVLELREDGKAYEVKSATFEPCYTGLEGFWTSDRFDWMLYASHEGSITIMGEWLLPAVQAAWPLWQRRIWTSPFYARL